CAPRLADMKASPAIQDGIERPAKKKSVLVLIYRLSAKPIPSTKTKYSSMITQSIDVKPIMESPSVSLDFHNILCYWNDSSQGAALIRAHARSAICRRAFPRWRCGDPPPPCSRPLLGSPKGETSQ